MEDAQFEEISRQQAALHADVDRVHAWGERHKEIFGGCWLDNAEAEAGTGPVRLTMAVTEQRNQLLDDLRRDLDHPQQLTVTLCRWNFETLWTLNSEIAQLMSQQTTDGSYISMCGVDVVANRVEVAIFPEDDLYAQQLLGRYGQDKVQIKQGVRAVAL